MTDPLTDLLDGILALQGCCSHVWLVQKAHEARALLIAQAAQLEEYKPIDLRSASESVGWANSVGPLSVSPTLRCRLCEKLQPCPEHGRTPVTDADFDELHREVSDALAIHDLESRIETLDGNLKFYKDACEQAQSAGTILGQRLHEAQQQLAAQAAQVEQLTKENDDLRTRVERGATTPGTGSTAAANRR